MLMALLTPGGLVEDHQDLAEVVLMLGEQIAIITLALMAIGCTPPDSVQDSTQEQGSRTQPGTAMGLYSPKAA